MAEILKSVLSVVVGQHFARILFYSTLLIPLPPVTRSSDVVIYLLVRRLEVDAFCWRIMFIRKS